MLDAERQLWNAAPFTSIRPEGDQPLQENKLFSASGFSAPAADSDVVWLADKAPGYWLKLRVRSQRDGRYVLSTNWPSYWDWIGFKSFAFYVRQEDGNTLLTKYQTVRGGRLAEGFSLTTPFALAFKLEKNQSKTFYIHLSGQDLPLPLEVKTGDQYVRDLRGQEFVFSVYYGVILSLIIFALAMSITLREFRFVWFVAYVLTELLLFLVSNGIIFLFCGQTDLALWNSIYFVLLGLIAVTTGLLAIQFLDMKTHAPFWYKSILLYMAISFAAAIGCIWVNEQYFYAYCLFFVFILALGPYIALAACIAIARRTKEKHGFFLAAWSFWVLGGSVDFLCYAGVIPYSQFMYHMLTLSSAAAGLLLMLALSERVSALRRANEIAQATNRTKNIFIAKVSHEIRTPMNAIIGLTELVLDSPLTPEQRDQLCTVQQCGQHLLDVVNDVLDFSKAEANKLILDIRHFDLHQLIRATLKGLSVLAEAKNLQLRWQESENLPRYVQGDQQRLRQILVNLVGNAIKFTDQGRVDIRVEQILPPEGDRMQLRFTVSDTGAGIPAEQLPHIFEDFSQARQKNSSEGTGLGLSICKELVKLMGGSIQARSELQKGSVFSFTIFLEPGSKEGIRQSPDTHPALQGAPGLKVLIADDNLINVKVAVAHLSRLGYATAAVGHGLEALEALAEANFDIVLMDLEMPKMNGIEAIRRIRSGQDRVRNPEIPVIVLTAYSIADAQEQCRGLGVNEFMIKPVSFHELASRINNIIYPLEPVSRTLDPTRATHARPPKHPVLDSATARLRLALDEEAYQTIFVLSLEELRGLREQLLARTTGDALFDSVTTVHTIKSTAATIGAVDLQHAAMDLEHKLRHRMQQDLAPALHNLLRAMDVLFEQYGPAESGKDRLAEAPSTP